MRAAAADAKVWARGEKHSNSKIGRSVARIKSFSFSSAFTVASQAVSLVTPCRMSYSVGAHSCDSQRQARSSS